jgi:hypothetical protein
VIAVADTVADTVVDTVLDTIAYVTEVHQNSPKMHNC